MGIEWELFDIHDFRGEPLRAKLESFLSKGDIAAVVYSNPNNPAWICLEESELKIIGELATQYGCDCAGRPGLFLHGLPSRRSACPYQPPFLYLRSHVTDNYILMLSASKIFSYAGQRIALACVSDKLFDTQYPALAARYEDSGVFGPTFIASIMYMITSGCTATTQYAMAEMLEKIHFRRKSTL